MKKNALLLNSEVICKVPVDGTADQIKGVITAIADGVITITETLSDEDKAAGKTAKVVTIPASSTDALAFIANPNVPEATVDDGTLVVNGKPVPTGFKVLDVIVALANRVYVTAETETEGRVAVYSYNVGKDEFYQIAGELAISGELIEAGKTLLLPYLNKRTETRKVKDEEGKEKEEEYEVYETAGFLIINSESTRGSIYGGLGLGKVLKTIPKADGTAIVVTTATSYIDGADYDEDYGYDEDDYDEEEDLEVEGEIKPYDGKVLVKVYSVKGRSIRLIYETLANGEVQAVTVAGRNTIVKTDKEIKVYTDGREYLVTKGYALTALAGYDYVVKDEVKDGNTTIVFANSKAELKTYKVEQSADRGELITVE